MHYIAPRGRPRVPRGPSAQAPSAKRSAVQTPPGQRPVSQTPCTCGSQRCPVPKEKGFFGAAGWSLRSSQELLKIWKRKDISNNYIHMIDFFIFFVFIFLGKLSAEREFLGGEP